MGCNCKIALILYAIVQFIAFAFMLVGTPFDMFRNKHQDLFGDTACMTLWGFKRKCYSTTYDVKVNTMYKICTERRDRFRAAEAFAILSILVFLVALVFGIVQLCCCRCLRWICLVLTIVGLFTSCVVWALMVDVYYNGRGCIAAQKTQKYGAGFALIVTAWCLEILGIVCLLLPC